MNQKFSPIFFQITLILILFFVTACDSIDENGATSTDSPKVRLITLSPHLAELVVSAGAIDSLVGVVSYSDFPEEIKSIKQVGDAFKLDYEAIIVLKPDYVLSWKGGTPPSVVRKLKSLNINVIETNMNQLSDIPLTIKQISDLTNTQTVAQPNITLFNQTLADLKQQTQKPQSLFIETFHQPLYTVSGEHWMSEAISICGYENIFSDLSQASATVNMEAVINKNPQAILNISKQEDPQWQKWESISAVKNNQVFTIDPDLFSRPSMRLLEGIKQLCSK